MSAKRSRRDLFETLRRAQAPAAAVDPHTLIQELQLHQIELELQNQELRETRQLLEESRGRYVDLYDSAPVPYLTLSPAGVIEQTNLAGAAMFGRKRKEDLLGKPFIGIVRLDDSRVFLSQLAACIERGATTSSELTSQMPSGTKTLQMTIAPVWATGAIIGCRVALTDVTERKTAEQAMHRAQRIAEHALTTRDALVHVVSHDLQNTLAAIRLQAAAISVRAGDPTYVRAGAKTIDETVHSGQRLVSDLVDLAAIESGEQSFDAVSVELGAIISQAATALRSAADDKGIELRMESDELAVSCDRDRIVQVLLNIVGNAIKFTPAGGDVSVDARNDGRDALIVVENSGPPIAPADRRHIFDKFWHSGRDSGSGLGLFIAKRIIEAHRGRLWLDDDCDRTRFCFTLPLG